MHGSSGSFVGSTGSGRSGFSTIWHEWHVWMYCFMSLPMLSHHNFEWIRCFVFIMSAWSLCTNGVVLFHNFVGRTIQLSQKMIFPVIPSSFSVRVCSAVEAYVVCSMHCQTWISWGLLFEHSFISSVVMAVGVNCFHVTSWVTSKCIC